MPKEEEFLRQLRATFRVEAGEHLQAIAQGLMALEKPGADEDHRKVIEATFRAAHSLKGAARAVNFQQVEAICQSLEDTFSAWKQGRAAPTREALDGAHRALDEVSAALGASAPQARPGDAESAAPQAAAAVPEAANAGTVRVTVEKLDARLLDAEEMLTARLAARQRVLELDALAAGFEPWRKQWSKVQPGVRGLRAQPAHAELAEFLEWNHDYLRALEGRVASMRQTAERDHATVGKLVDDLLADSKKLLMLPFSHIGALFPKLVRDLARDQGKEAAFEMHGGQAEIDRRILDEMKDPLIHLLRNAVDHGVEPPALRVRAGKPARATIRLQVEVPNGSQVHIRMSDDGAGIDVPKLKASAVERGVLDARAAEDLDEADAQALAFAADVSTSPMVTALSGRGLGLAIVLEKTQRLGGQVAVRSEPGQGTQVDIRLPVTLATFRGILVGLAQRTFVLPTSEVERVLRFRAGDVRTVKGRRTLTVGGRTVPLVRMSDVLELQPSPVAADAALDAVVLGVGENRIAFTVDAVLDEQEVLVKPLARPLERVRNVAGATILGSGQVAPILRVSDLLKSARMVGEATSATAEPPPPASPTAKSVLVAEDSITSRMLLKGILESAGYRVQTAVDGMDAFTALRTGQFDLLVSDVEMPRLNGFDLTARIRADRRLAALPVVLVTALERREDRERGVEVGANAYLVKSGLDQGNLLDAIRRLA